MVQTCFISHPYCQLHEMAPRHPESPARLLAIEQQLNTQPWSDRLSRRQAREISLQALSSVHPMHYIDALSEMDPGEGLASIDADTAINSHSLRAARLAAGAGLDAVEVVLGGDFSSAFCAVRPPGHHAETAIGMGFCLFNSIALAAERALSLGAKRVAIVDFDVHHGNGTVEIFRHRPEVLVCSSFQFPFYPGRYDDISAPNIVLTPLPAGTTGDEFRCKVERVWRDSLTAHQPDILLVSAGFDAHKEDPVGGICLADEDFFWLGQFLHEQANALCGGRIVSMLEGGYDLSALGRSVEQYLLGTHT